MLGNKSPNILVNTVWKISGWMKALANAMTNRLEERTETLFKKEMNDLK